MSFLSPPISKYKNPYDLERFQLSWNVSLIVVSALALLTIYYALTANETMYPTLAGTVVMSFAVLSMKVTKKFKPAALIIAIFGSAANQYNIFFVTNAQIVSDLLWILSLCLFIFYALGVRVGSWVMVINVIGITSSFFLIPKEVFEAALENQDLPDRIDTAFNFVISAFLCMLIIIKSISSSRKAEEDSVQVQQELREQNTIINSQNEEKTVMLREIHHRVKNNLQVITSLLRLQSREIKDVATLEHFREAVNRVLSMALIHDKLYQSDDLSKVDFKGYLEDLASDLTASYSTEIPIRVEVESSIEHLVPKSLVSVGLLFNELISNSLKHGFANNDEGIIKIRIYNPDSSTIEMYYSDNGEWKDPRREDSFGLELVETLSSQLMGSFERTTNDGTQYHFTFEIEK